MPVTRINVKGNGNVKKICSASCYLILTRKSLNKKKIKHRKNRKNRMGQLLWPFN